MSRNRKQEEVDEANEPSPKPDGDVPKELPKEDSKVDVN